MYRDQIKEEIHMLLVEEENHRHLMQERHICISKVRYAWVYDNKKRGIDI
jgi:hypothetical protein